MAIQRLRRGRDRHRARIGLPLVGDQRRALPDPRRRRRTRRAALHQHRQDARRPRGCGSTRRSSSSAARRRCTRRCPATRRPSPPRRGSPRWSSRTTRASAWASAAPLLRTAGRQDARRLPPRAQDGPARTVRRAPRPRGTRAPRPRAGNHRRMGFASYFLIVWDFVRYARERDIPALARGSACGALVSYLLKLSSVCPLKYDLLFERFLDPSRSEAPDIDIDLCQETRYEVIEYVRKKYGDANVAQIGTFGTLKAKAAIKDVGRGAEYPAAAGRADQQASPGRLNITSRGAQEEPALQRLPTTDPEVAQAAGLRPSRLRASQPQRRHARRGRRDRRPPARRRWSRSRSSPTRQGRRGRHHPVGDGRHREGRPPEDGLSRPA